MSGKRTDWEETASTSSAGHATSCAANPELRSSLDSTTSHEWGHGPNRHERYPYDCWDLHCS
jgi:hypothetical protein